MNKTTRRTFLRTASFGAGALAIAPAASHLARAFIIPRRDVVFRPYPHPSMPPLSFVYAADESEDPFKSSMNLGQSGIVIPEDVGEKKFSVNMRWYVEGFGYVWLSADNEGKKYTLREATRMGDFHLNYEFARSRVSRNKGVAARYRKEGAEFSAEVKHLTALSEELLLDAAQQLSSGEKAARLADLSLKYALWAGEKIELEKAKSDIAKMKRAEKVKFGCETRQYIWAKHEDFTKRFVEVMNHATVTHYIWDTWYELFEPREGVYNWGVKDNIVNWLTENGISIEGRPLIWFHPAVTPEWLKKKNFDEIKKYVERHVRNLVTHYGDKVEEWEVVNEYHDWANIHNHTPDQITEIVRLACDKTKEANPKVSRLLNNCCPWAEYAARGRMARMDATRPLRSPRKFLQELTDAGVDYDVLGIQIYFPQRDLSDIVRLLERLAAIGKPIAITEIGASSNLVTQAPTGAITAPKDEPFSWHRHWDEELQADWLEQVYTIFYSKPYIKAINWYDFSDFRPFIANGGLVREDSSAKQSFFRLKNLLASWGQLPKKREQQ
ncbi:MAG: endo-1,4-beta-xylanase [Ignavibacteriales bacterium]|nr:endo-1,4-beta-xylanase [Ignavibacteriales bacterium]